MSVFSSHLDAGSQDWRTPGHDFDLMFLRYHFVLQESYAMLNRYELLVAKEESETVDTLRYSWQKLQSLAVNSLLMFVLFVIPETHKGLWVSGYT